MIEFDFLWYLMIIFNYKIAVKDIDFWFIQIPLPAPAICNKKSFFRKAFFIAKTTIYSVFWVFNHCIQIWQFLRFEIWRFQVFFQNAKVLLPSRRRTPRMFFLIFYQKIGCRIKYNTNGNFRNTRLYRLSTQ